MRSYTWVTLLMTLLIFDWTKIGETIFLIGQKVMDPLFDWIKQK